MTERLELEHKVKIVSPREAFELLQREPRGALIDVRSSIEFLFVGHPKGAIHIAWVDEPDWTINPHFVQDVRRVILGGMVSHTRGPAPVVLICRSGNRSLEAGAVLSANGFDLVYSVDTGFEGPLDEQHHRGAQAGWRFEGLPWEQC